MGGARRAAAILVAAAAFLALAPVVAVADSITGRLIRQLNRQLLYLAVPIALLVETILVYAVWRFRGEDDPSPTSENRQLELTWTAATALVLLFVGTASFAVLAHPFVAAVPGSHSHGGHSHQVQPGQAPPDAVEVIVVAEQWDYTFRYPAADVTSQDELVLPTNRTVYLYVVSEDVLHSFHVPALGLKQDAFPGQYNLIRTRILEPGEHRLYCAEYCGTGHSQMTTTLVAVPPSEYEAWLADQNDSAVTGANGTSGHP